jgi:SPP1 family predicted phage head-tail adaptor
VRFYVDPGRLRQRLSLQAADQPADGLGGHALVWREIAVVFGLIEPVAAKSLVEADQRLTRLTHRVTLRARDDIAAGMRLVKNDRAFLIRTRQDPDESGRYLVCQVEEDEP